MSTKDSLFGLDGLGVGSAEVILFAAVISAVVALIVVAQQRIIAKKGRAYDLCERFLQTDRLAADVKLVEIAKSTKWDTIVGSKESIDHGARQQIVLYLNACELMCVAIRQNIVDEGVVKDIIGDRLVYIHMHAQPLILIMRQKKDDQEFFEHFEFVANRWKENPKSLPRNGWRAIISEIVRI